MLNDVDIEPVYITGMTEQTQLQKAQSNTTQNITKPLPSRLTCGENFSA